MKELLHAIKCVIILQIICWGIFILCDECPFIHQSSAVDLALFTSCFILTGLIILYFIYINKHIEKHNLKKVKFNIFLLFTWMATSTAISYGCLMLVDSKHLHVCKHEGWSCLLNGVEYGIQGILMLITAAIIILIQLIIILIKHIKKTRIK